MAVRKRLPGGSRGGSRADSSALSLPRASRSYAVVLAAVVGLLTTGLVLPLAFGDRTVDDAAVDAGRITGDLGSASVPPRNVLETTTTVAPAPRATAGDAAAGDSMPAASPSAPAGAPVAQATGVTTTTIRVGIIIGDYSGLVALGLGFDNYEPETQRRIWATLIRDVNRRGGIHGRTIEPVYAVQSVFDEGAGRATCLRLAKDERVLAVMGIFASGDAVRCFTEEYRVPTMLNTGTYSQLYGGGYLMTAPMSFERSSLSWAGWLHQTGIVRGRKLGLVAGEGIAEKAPADALAQALDRLGYRIAYRARLSEDPSTSQSQVPIEVQKMRAAGVDTVLDLKDAVTMANWVNNAQTQGWRPQYLLNDHLNNATNGLVRNMPSSFDGAIAVTALHLGEIEAQAGEAEPPEARTCREGYNRANPGAKQLAWGENGPHYWLCGMMQTFERAATAAGPNLDRASFVAAEQRLGRFPLPGVYGGSFAPGKTDFADLLRPLRWSYACRCYRVAGPPVAARGVNG